jgi:hypothetical protein
VTGTLGITDGGTGLTSAGANGTMLVSRWSKRDSVSTRVQMASSIDIIPAGGPAWGAGASTGHLTGTTGTNPTTNCLGTLDNQALSARVNHMEQMQVTTGAKQERLISYTPTSALAARAVVNTTNFRTNNVPAQDGTRTAWNSLVVRYGWFSGYSNIRIQSS